MSLRLELDQGPVAGQGGVVSGKAILHILPAEICAQHLEIRINGNEVTNVWYADGSKGGSVATNKRALFALNYSLAVFDDGKVQQGQYEYPFRIALPEKAPCGGWPSSVYMKAEEPMLLPDSCQVRYVAEAVLFTTENSYTNLTNPKVEAAFRVESRNRPSIVPQEKRANMSVESCICLFYHGEAYLTA